MVEQGKSELKEEKAGLDSHALDRAQTRLQKAYDMLDGVILPTLLLEKTDKPGETHPADVINLERGSKEWTSRTSTTMSSTMRLLEAAAELREAAAFMGDGDLAPVLAVLHALENWQQSLFGGTVNEETQTPAAATEDEGENHDKDEECGRGAKKPKRKWFGLTGVNEEEIAALETDSFLADLNEVEMLPTLPLPGELPNSQSSTMPWSPPTAVPVGTVLQPTTTEVSQSEGEVVLQKANEMARDLQLQLNLADAFVPGVRRGFVLIPIAADPGEPDDAMRQRVQACIRRVNSANITLGRKPDGNPAKLWLTVSQPPERRRRAALAGKIKRLLIEVGGPAIMNRIEPEWATGTVWFKNAKVSSGSSPAPQGSSSAGCGWIDITTIATKLNVDRDTVEKAWEPLLAALR
ncbi:unnamed protein product [Symbiodinium sp. CCMP2592]|nr:unnamed protein product [Symbiodinium sp. CCMP2592]